MKIKLQNTFTTLAALIIYINVVKAQVDAVGDQFFTYYYDEVPTSLPLFSNIDINEENSQADKAIVVLHGANRNADEYFNSVYSAASYLSIQNETIIIAPQFLLLEDIESWELSPDTPYWQNLTGWTIGNKSISTAQHPRDFQLSSYTIMDSLLSFINNEFTNVNDIILVGNSAGAQFINRYAGGSPLPFDDKIRFVISAPSSFLYFDENRYQYPNSWGVPSNCNNYNRYKYGLGDLNNYMSTSGEDSIIARYQKRNIMYLVGEQDNGGTTDCQSMVQGQNRIERSLTYYNYLQYFYNSEITNNHKIAIISNVNHNHDQIFNSSCGRKAIFGLDDCQQIENLTAPSALFSNNINSGNYPLVVNFINSSIAGTHEIKYSLWLIENESIYTDENLEYTFNYPGEYDVSLIVIDEIGQHDTTTFEASVAVDTLYGDVNFDAILNSVDVENILIYSIGGMPFDTIQVAVGDLDNDGTLSPFDGSLILQYLDNNINQIPIENNDEFAASGGLKELELSGNIDEIIQIPIVIENVENVYSFELTINFDPNIISSATIYPADLSAYGSLIESTILENGKILIAGSGSIAADNEIEIANFYFIPLDFLNGEIILQSENFYLNNSRIEDIFTFRINQNLSIEPHPYLNDFSLGDNFPNPFNSTTKIMFNLNEDFNIKININDIRGNLVKSLIDGFCEKGTHTVHWDGKDNERKSVVSGVYFYKILVDGKSSTKKMLFVK